MKTDAKDTRLAEHYAETAADIMSSKWIFLTWSAEKEHDVVDPRTIKNKKRSGNSLEFISWSPQFLRLSLTATGQEWTEGGEQRYTDPQTHTRSEELWLLISMEFILR